MAYTLTYTLNSDGNSYTLSGYSGDKPTGELVIPDSYDSKPVTIISQSAFAYCNKLTSITIPNSVMSIGNSAFRDCFGLTSITIGNGVTSIGDWAFAYCSGLTSINVAAGNTKYHSNGNCLIETETKTLILGCKTSVIPADGSVTSIGDWAFAYCSGLMSITIPGSITSIGSSAFRGCSSLTSITIPDSVTTIGSYAFSGCSSLASITIPFVGGQAGKTSSDTLQYPFGYIFGASSYTGGTATKQEYYGSYAGVTVSVTYYIPSSLKSVTVTGGNILRGAFHNCTGLVSITIPSSVTNIREFAFSGCSSLTSITIPVGVTSIGQLAFYDCSGLTNIYYTGDISSWCGINGLGNIMSDSRTLYIDDNKIEGELVIPDSVTSIGGSAFYGCSGLTSVTIPNSVTSIGYGAFYNCSKLTSVTISDSVTSIGDSAFAYCSGLTSITIPVGVTSIGQSAFSGCSSLAKINMLPTTPPTIQNNTLILTIQNIYVPSQSAETYKTATNWNSYADKITEFPLLDLGSLLMYNNKVKQRMDADGDKNEDTYAKQNGSYPNLTAGKANIHTTELLPLDADLNNYYGADYWGKNYYVGGGNSIVNRPIANDSNGFSLEILRGSTAGTVQRCILYARGGSPTQPVVFTRWYIGDAWKEWQEAAEAIGTYPNMTVGKATNLTEPFIIGSDTNTAQTWVTKFATITLKAAWVSSATRFEIVDTDYTNNTTQPVGVEISASPSTTALTVRAYVLYGNPQILNNIYISYSAVGTFPMTVDLYYSIENTAYTTIGIKPLWQARRSTNSNVEFITTNTNVGALPTDRTNVRLTELANYAVITRAGYDGNGNNIANTYAKKVEISNPNLLVNPDFSINQRGQKSYTGKGYSVDRWKGYQLNAMVCTPRDGYGVTLSAPTEITSTGGIYFQPFEASQLPKLAGRTVTISFKVSANRGTSNIYVRTMANANSVGDTPNIGSGVSGVVSKTLTLPSPLTSLEIVFRKGTGTLDVDIDWAKLEIGSTATEFIPPLTEEELLKCQALSTDPVQLLRSNSEVFTGLAAGQPIEKIVFNPNVSIEKMTDYLSGLTYDEAIKYDETAPEVQCVCKLVSIDWFNNSIAVYAINFNAFSSMMGTSGYAIGVVDTSVDGFVVKQTVFATEYSEANLQLVTAMADKNYTVQYTQAGWNDTKDYVLDTSTNHMIVGVYDNKVSAFIGRDSRFFDVIEMLDDNTTATSGGTTLNMYTYKVSSYSIAVVKRIYNILKNAKGSIIASDGIRIYVPYVINYSTTNQESYTVALTNIYSYWNTAEQNQNSELTFRTVYLYTYGSYAEFYTLDIKTTKGTASEGFSFTKSAAMSLEIKYYNDVEITE